MAAVKIVSFRHTSEMVIYRLFHTENARYFRLIIFLSWRTPSAVPDTHRLQGGKQALCRVHLVPIRGGLLTLPRLDVSAEGSSAGQGGVEVWTPDLRKVLVLPPGDAASVCQARAP